MAEQGSVTRDMLRSVKIPVFIQARPEACLCLVIHLSPALLHSGQALQVAERVTGLLLSKRSALFKMT